MSGWHFGLMVLAGFSAIVVLFWISVETGHNVAALAAPMILTPLVVGLFALWRIKRQAKRLGYRGYRLFACGSRKSSRPGGGIRSAGVLVGRGGICEFFRWYRGGFDLCVLWCLIFAGV